MSTMDVGKPLSSKERAELETLLESRDRDDPIAGITGLHGLLTCIVSGPMVMPSEWLPMVFGDEDDRGFATFDLGQRAIGLLMRFHNEVASELDAGGDRSGFPRDRIGDVEKWCRGYVFGTSFRASEWQEAMDEDDEFAFAIAPIVTMLTPEIARDLRRNQPKKYAQLVDSLPSAAAEVHQWWRKRYTAQASERAHPTVRRATPKISPNAPCPCGSGKKYKRCCSPYAQSSEPPLSPRAERESAESRGSHQPQRPRQPRRVWKITIRLRHVMPIVWRTILVRPETKLVMLHRYIQAAMGWRDHHIFAFKIGAKEYGIPHPDFRDMKVYDARRYTLERLFPDRPTSFEYVYDFGDNWEHLVEIEQEEDARYRQRYPICIDGAEPCPPEDCGGPGRYAELRSVLNNPNHPDHAEILAWTRSQTFHSNFDVQWANWDLRDIGV